MSLAYSLLFISILAIIAGVLVICVTPVKSGISKVGVVIGLLGVAGVSVDAHYYDNQSDYDNDIASYERDVRVGYRGQQRYRYDHLKYVHAKRQLHAMSANDARDPKASQLRVGQIRLYLHRQEQLKSYVKDLNASCIQDRKQTRRATPKHLRHDREHIHHFADSRIIAIHQHRILSAKSLR